MSVFVRSPAELPRARAAVQAAGLPVTLLDAAENGLAVIESNKHHEAAKYISQTEHQRNLSALYINEKKLASMPADLQKIVPDAALEASAHERKKDAELVAAAAERLKSEGAILTTPDKAKFIALIAPIQDEVAKELKTTDLLQIVRRRRGRYRLDLLPGDDATRL